jgi:hypothetical protein
MAGGPEAVMKSRISSGVWAASLFLIGLSAAGCGDDASEEHASGGAGGETATAAAGGTGGTAGTAGADVGGAPGWSSECADVVEQNASCNKSSSDDAAREECVGMEVCIGPVYDADAVHALMQCLATLPCDSPDDDCIEELVSLPGNEAQAAFVQACQAKATECPELAGDLCGMGVWFSDSLNQAIEACFDQPCSTAVPCAFMELADTSAEAGCGGELPLGG